MLLETLEIFRGTDADDRYDLHFSNYGGQTIRVQFRYVPGHFPGSDEFIIDWASYFVY